MAIDLDCICSNSICFLKSQMLPDGSFALAEGEPPTASGTAGAILAIGLLNAWDEFASDLRNMSAVYLDRAQDGEGKVAADIVWSECTTARHDPAHVIWCNCCQIAWAYRACGRPPARPYRFVRRFLDLPDLGDGLDCRVWDVNPWLEGNKIHCLQTCLQALGWSDPDARFTFLPSRWLRRCLKTEPRINWASNSAARYCT